MNEQKCQLTTACSGRRIAAPLIAHGIRRTTTLFPSMNDAMRAVAASRPSLIGKGIGAPRAMKWFDANS